MCGAGDGAEIRTNLTIGLAADCYRPTASGVVTSLVQLRNGLERRGHRVILITVATPHWGLAEPHVYPFPSLPFNATSGFRLGLIRPGSVRRILQKERVDVVHTHTEFGVGWAARCAAQNLSLPLVHTGHTLYEHYLHYLAFGKALPLWLIQGYLRAFLRGYDALVCPSRKAQDYYGPLGPKLKTLVIGNGMVSNSFPAGQRARQVRAQVRQALGIQPSEWVILYVGRIGPEKRTWELLLEVLVPVLRAQKRARALLVGSGPQHRALAEAAARSGTGKRILLPGAVPWERMHEFYLAADLLASASLSEVHPMTLLEANACGLPAIVRRDKAYDGLVVHGYNGYLADSDEQLAGLLSAILPDSGELQRLSGNAARQAEHYTVEAHAARLEALYRQLL